MQRAPWCVLHVVANHEKRVAQHLGARSVEHYLPLYAQRSRWTDRMVDLQRPLFPGYIFVRFASQARHAAMSVPGVLRLLGETERDMVSEVEIARIREGLESGRNLQPAQIALGMPVRVRAGSFAGAEGVVTDFRGQCRLVMVLSATRQCFSLEVDRTEIEVLCAPPFRQVMSDLALQRPSL